MKTYSENMSNPIDHLTVQDMSAISSTLLQESMLAIVSLEGDIVKVSKRFEAMFYDDGAGKDSGPLHFNGLIDEKGPRNFFSDLKEEMKTTNLWTGQIRLKNNRNQSFHAFMQISQDMKLSSYILQVFPLGQVNEYERLRSLAYTDELTGIQNFRNFRERMNEKLGRGAKFGLLFIDIDHFKKVNDVYGHVVGDKVLKACASRLVKCAFPWGQVYRKSGDEFVMIVDELNRIDKMIRQILKEFERPFFIEGRNMLIRISIGSSCYPKQGIEMEPLIRMADESMYLAKKHKKYKVIHG